MCNPTYYKPGKNENHILEKLIETCTYVCNVYLKVHSHFVLRTEVLSAHNTKLVI
jgi:hypothetical protein